MQMVIDKGDRSPTKPFRSIFIKNFQHLNQSANTRTVSLIKHFDLFVRSVVLTVKQFLCNCHVHCVLIAYTTNMVSLRHQTYSLDILFQYGQISGRCPVCIASPRLPEKYCRHTVFAFRQRLVHFDIIVSYAIHPDFNGIIN